MYPRSAMTERAPIKPEPLSTPQPPVPTTVSVSAADADLAAADWDQTMPADYAGLLDATVQGG